MTVILEARAQEVRRELGVPALGLALVDRDRDGFEGAVTGVRRRGLAEVASIDDQWHIGSCGKSMTAALYARLVERGEADWGARLPDLFPDLADGMDPTWSAVTIDEVLLHRAGLPADLDRTTLAAAYADPWHDREQRTELAAACLRRAAVGVGAFRYSNVGYMLAGAAIERLTGTHVEQAYQEYLLRPLGMTSAGWGPPDDLAGHRGRFVLGSLALGRGRPTPRSEARGDNPRVMTPAGRLHVSLADWCRYLRLFLDADNPFLARSTVERLLALPSDPGPRQAMGWAAADGLPGVGLGQQGSNMLWMATALLDADRRRAAIVVTNDGRTRLLRSTPLVAAELLRAS